MARTEFQYRDPRQPGFILCEVVDLDTGKDVERWVRPEAKPDQLRLAVIGTLGLYQLSFGNLEEEKLREHTGTGTRELEVLANGAIPWKDGYRNGELKKKLDVLTRHLIDGNEGLERVLRIWE